MKIFNSLLLCVCLSPSLGCSNADNNGGSAPNDPFDPIELIDLLPATTRGVFQIYPGTAGAIADPVVTAPWAAGPLQVLQKYSGEMDVTGAAQRLLLAQMSDRLDQFVLLAELHTLDVNTLWNGIDLTELGRYKGYQRWIIEGTDLQLAQLNGMTLAIAPAATLERVLNVYAGDEDGIESGALGSYLSDLYTEQPNSFVYGLPALYGAVAAPGNGNASLSQARVVSGAVSIDGDTLAGTMAFYSDNAATFTNTLLDILSGYPTPAITASADSVSIDLTGLSAQEDLRPLVKSLVLDMDAVDYAAAVAHGSNAPWLNFKVGENPNSIFINFEFRGLEERKAFEAEHLPAGFTLAPIRILDTDSPRYFLVLNMYQSAGGLVQGARAEWSVFINDPDTNEPRFLVIEAVADSIAADSVNLLTLPEPVTHTLKTDAIVSYVGAVNPDTQAETLYFTSTIDWPQSPETRVKFAREFVASNDYIFWGNGVADRGLYNSSVHNREAVLVDPDQFSFIDNTGWTAFINSTPVHAVTYLNPLEIVISPWWNLDAPYLDVTEAHRATLIDFKNEFYPSLAQGNAQAAMRGEGAALSAAIVSGATPTVSYHFTLLDPHGLVTAVAGAGGPTPIPVALFDGETAGYYLTLTVYERENDPCGLRAEWLTYVENSDGQPQSLRLDAFAAEPCLDPVSLMTFATDLTQVAEATSIVTRIASPFVHFESSVDLGLAESALADQNWLEAGDRVCSLNNICDEFYYDGQSLLAPALRANSSGVQIRKISSPWDDYIDIESVRAGVRTNAAIQASNPWRNLRSFAGDTALP